MGLPSLFGHGCHNPLPNKAVDSLLQTFFASYKRSRGRIYDRFGAICKVSRKLLGFRLDNSPIVGYGERDSRGLRVCGEQGTN